MSPIQILMLKYASAHKFIQNMLKESGLTQTLFLYENI